MRSVIRELFSDTSTRNSRERTFPLAPRLRYAARVKPRCYRFFAANFLLVFFLAFAAQRTGVAQTAIETLVWDAGAGRVSADIRFQRADTARDPRWDHDWSAEDGY